MYADEIVLDRNQRRSEIFRITEKNGGGTMAQT